MAFDYGSITKQQFDYALSNLELSSKERRMLCEHMWSTGRVATMTNIAAAAGYTYRGGNSQYGKLARRIAEILDVPLPRTKLFLLCEFVAPNKQTNRHYLISMRQSFAAALERHLRSEMASIRANLSD